jgi:hypothetical protein
MCKNMFKMPSMPAPPAPVAPPAPAASIAPLPEPIKDADERMAKSMDDTKKRAAALASLSQSQTTSPLGLTSQAYTTKSLLGQ